MSMTDYMFSLILQSFLHQGLIWLVQYVSNVATISPNLLTWINYNPSMDMHPHPLQSVEWNYLSIPKLQRCNRLVVSSHTWQGMWLLIHAGI